MRIKTKVILDQEIRVKVIFISLRLYLINLPTHKYCVRILEVVFLLTLFSFEIIFIFVHKTIFKSKKKNEGIYLTHIDKTIKSSLAINTYYIGFLCKTYLENM